MVYAPPTLLAPLPEPQRDPLIGGLVSGVTSFLSAANPILGQAASVYGALEAKKQAKDEAKRQHQLELAAVQAQGAQGRAWLTAPVAIGAVAAVALLAVLFARR